VKRFWKEVAVEAEDGGWGIRLDGKPVRTPARAPLAVPSQALAEAIAAEWRDSGEEVDPRAMPLTGLANAAIDRVAAGHQAFADGLARYAETDLACYRSEGPRGLAERQQESWDALLGWARRRYDVDFATTTGLTHVTQPAATVERLAHAVAALDPFRLAGLSPLVTMGGSLVAGVAVLDRAMTPDQAWDAVSVDERWQLDQWGSDAAAEAALANRRRDFMAAARFLELLATSARGRPGRGRSRPARLAANASAARRRRSSGRRQGSGPCRR
jgi:chaperone required for assembly of F1-ATPase